MGYEPNLIVERKFKDPKDIIDDFKSNQALTPISSALEPNLGGLNSSATPSKTEINCESNLTNPNSKKNLSIPSDSSRDSTTAKTKGLKSTDRQQNQAGSQKTSKNVNKELPAAVKKN